MRQKCTATYVLFRLHFMLISGASQAAVNRMVEHKTENVGIANKTFPNWNVQARSTGDNISMRFISLF